MAEGLDLEMFIPFRKGRRIGSSRWITSRQRLYRLSRKSWKNEFTRRWSKVSVNNCLNLTYSFLVNETEILNEEEKKFKRELLTMFVEELKGFVQNYAVQVLPQVPVSVYRYPINAWLK